MKMAGLAIFFFVPTDREKDFGKGIDRHSKK